MKNGKPRNYVNYIRFELDLVLSCGKLRENMKFKENFNRERNGFLIN
jgi:hypothetical protein